MTQPGGESSQTLGEARGSRTIPLSELRTPSDISGAYKKLAVVGGALLASFFAVKHPRSALAVGAVGTAGVLAVVGGLAYLDLAEEGSEQRFRSTYEPLDPIYWQSSGN